jgi:hypothetical protein
MDPWDDVLNAEGQAYQDGVQDGIIAAKEEGHFNDGIKAGYLRAFALGLEFGFMESTISASAYQSVTVPTTKRIEKRRVEVIGRIKNIPINNAFDFDFDKELHELRGLYKQCGTAVGGFLPSKLTVDQTSDW